MTQLFTNNARAVLASGISDSATSIVLDGGFGDLFPIANLGTGVPNVAVGDWFKLTLENDAGQREIVIVRTRGSGSDILSNVMRGAEGTTPRAWDTGTVVGLRPTAGDIANILAFNPALYVPLAGGVTIPGALTFGGETQFQERITTPPDELEGTTPEISSAKAMWTWETEGDSTPTFDVPIGTSTTVQVTLGGAHTVIWSGVSSWLWNSPPEMEEGQTHIVSFFNFDGQVRGDWGGRF